MNTVSTPETYIYPSRPTYQEILCAFNFVVENV